MESLKRRKTDHLEDVPSTKLVHPLVRAGYYILSAFFAIGLAVLLLFIYWTNFPYNVLEVKQPVPLVDGQTQVFSPGQKVVFEAQYCKTLDVDEATITRKLVGRDREISLPVVTVYTSVVPGCNSIPLSNSLPPDLTGDGEYFIRYNITYRPNPLREVTEEFVTVPFTVGNTKDVE